MTSVDGSDPVVYPIVISHGGGSLEAALVEDENPLVTWAVTTESELARCATRKTDRMLTEAVR